MENEHSLTPTNPEVPGNFEDLLDLIKIHNDNYEKLNEDEKFELNQKILRLKLKLNKENMDISQVPSLYKEGEHKGIILP